MSMSVVYLKYRRNVERQQRNRSARMRISTGRPGSVGLQAHGVKGMVVRDRQWTVGADQG